MRTLSTAQVAELTPYSVRQIERRLRDPKHPLQGVKDGRRWLVSEESVHRWLGKGYNLDVDPEIERLAMELIG